MAVGEGFRSTGVLLYKQLLSMIAVTERLCLRSYLNKTLLLYRCSEQSGHLFYCSRGLIYELMICFTITIMFKNGQFEFSLIDT